jgi:rhodanese-related sulfurtransferase
MAWKQYSLLPVLVLLSIPLFSDPCQAQDDDAPRISREAVKALLNDPTVVILDARLASDWKASDKKIRGAVRVNPHDVSAWAGNYPKDKKIIVYCS